MGRGGEGGLGDPTSHRQTPSFFVQKKTTKQTRTTHIISVIIVQKHNIQNLAKCLEGLRRTRNILARNTNGCFVPNWIYIFYNTGD